MSAASNYILTALVPDVPTGLTLVQRNSNSMTFKWIAPEDKGGVELLSYKIYVAQANNQFSQILDAPSQANPSITVNTEKNLTSAETYRFKISAVNIVGEGKISEEIFVIAADMPMKPAQAPIITLITQTSITLTLQPLPYEFNGGSNVTGYIV